MPFSFHLSDGPAVVHVNIFIRSISKIDDVTMVSDCWQRRMSLTSVCVVLIGTLILVEIAHLSSPVGRDGVRVLSVSSGAAHRQPRACMRKWPMRDVIGAVPRSRDCFLLTE